MLAGGATALLKAGVYVEQLVLVLCLTLYLKESDGHNALGALTKHCGWADTPLTTKRHRPSYNDESEKHNEGMGIGLIADGAFFLVGKGSTKVQQIRARNDSVKSKQSGWTNTDT